MPSASVLSGYTFSNWGPLTTTYTPPASCQTTGPWGVYIAPSSLPSVPVAQATCAPDTDFYSCRPTGTITNLPTGNAYYNNPRGVYTQQYYSPGLYCPSGWHEVGAASRDGNKPVDSTGFFSPPTPLPSTSSVFLGMNQPENVLMQLLDPSETAVVCCPASMTADQLVGCYSTLRDYKISTGCNRFLPNADVSTIPSTEIWLYGTTVEGQLETLLSSLPVTQTQARSFAPSESSAYVAATSVYPITLVHQPTDLGKTNAASTTNAASKTSAATTTNAAARLKPRPSTGNHLVGILGVAAAAMVLGAAIVL